MNQSSRQVFPPDRSPPWWVWIVVPLGIVVALELVALIPERVLAYYPTVYIGAGVCFRWFGRIRTFIQERESLIDFRSMSREAQQEFLTTVWPRGLRRAYLNRVDMDETYQVLEHETL